MAAIIKPRVARYRGTSATSREVYPQGAAQTYQADALVFINSAGKIAQCDGAIPGNITAVYGLDVLPASAVDTDRNVEGLTSDAEIIASIVDSTALGLDVTSQSLVGKKFALIITTVGATQFWTVDVANAVDQIVEITKIAPEHPIGETNGEVYCKILKDLLQFQP
jgi:hypothetical protein